MKAVAALLTLFVAASSVAASAPTSLDHQHAAAHHITFHSKAESDSCSAVSVGPHTLLTADHCLIGTATMGVDDQTARILGTAFDENDHLLITVDLTFFAWLPIEVRELKANEVVHSWGNPGASLDVFTAGFFQKVILDRNIGVLEQFVLPTFPGDSGSGIISESGAVVGIVSLGDDSAHAFALPFAFTPAQLAAIR